MTKTAQELSDEAIHLALNIMDPWYEGSARWDEVVTAINALRDLAQSSQARTGGGAVASLIERLKAFRGPYLGDGVHTGIHRDELLAVLAIPPGNATQAAGAREPRPLNGHCAAGTDGDCFHRDCPQTRDGEPHKSGRSCPLHQYSDED